jgi:hypothetical protein
VQELLDRNHCEVRKMVVSSVSWWYDFQGFHCSGRGWGLRVWGGISYFGGRGLGFRAASVSPSIIRMSGRERCPLPLQKCVLAISASVLHCISRAFRVVHASRDFAVGEHSAPVPHAGDPAFRIFLISDAQALRTRSWSTTLNHECGFSFRSF